MADIIVVVGLEVGDDFTTLSSALASVPSDLTTLDDNYVIELRDDQTHGGMTLPTPTTGPSNRLVIRAFPGDETDGAGNGSKLEVNRAAGVIRIGVIDYFDLAGLYVNQLGSARSVLITGTTANHTSISGCFIRSVSGDSVEVSNASGSFLNIDNTILVNDTGAICLDFGSGSDNTTRTINRLTAIGGTTRAVDRISSTQAQNRAVNYTNCLLFSNASQTFPTLSNTINAFDSDFNATGDALGTLNSLTTGFNNRLITDDLEDPNGATPNYNLKPTSTLIGSGSDGGNIGATLGAVAPPTGVTIQVTESYGDFTESITATVTPDVNISIQITELYDSFTESSSVAVSEAVSLEATITESYNDFTELVNVAISKDIDLSITESYSDFSEMVVASVPVSTVINHRNTIKVNRNKNRVTIQKTNNVIKVR